MNKTLLEKLQTQEHKKYSMMSQFSLLFTSPEGFNGRDMKSNLKILKELAEGFLSVIDSQCITFDKDNYSKIHSELKEQREILVRIVSKINKIDADGLYEDRDEITLIHADVEKFDAKTKDVKSLAQGFLLRM